MFNINPTLRFFGFCFGLFLVLVFSACEKENSEPNSSLSDGSFVELTYEGKTYRVNGVGRINVIDTAFIDNGQAHTVQLLTVGVLELRQEQASKSGVIQIWNYSGTGRYTLYNIYRRITSGIFFEPNASGFEHVIYSSFTDDEYIGTNFDIVENFTNHEVIVTQDNSHELSGTFSFEAMGSSRTGAIPEGPARCTGRFKIVK